MRCLSGFLGWICFVGLLNLAWRHCTIRSLVGQSLEELGVDLAPPGRPPWDEFTGIGTSVSVVPVI